MKPTQMRVRAAVSSASTTALVLNSHKTEDRVVTSHCDEHGTLWNRRALCSHSFPAMGMRSWRPQLRRVCPGAFARVRAGLFVAATFAKLFFSSEHGQTVECCRNLLAELEQAPAPPVPAGADGIANLGGTVTSP